MVRPHILLRRQSNAALGGQRPVTRPAVRRFSCGNPGLPGTGVRAAQDLPGTTTMSRRGFTECESEWLLACAARNLRKLHRHRLRG